MGMQPASYVMSATERKGCPREKIPEYAFVGRSNVGKSSLINMLTGVKGLARTSATPGKTRLLNFYSVEDLWYLVDLPGYGFAKISKTEREKWERMIHDYILHRKSLMYTFVLIDSRLEPQKSDLAFINWLGNHQLPFCLVFTKADKLSRNKLQSNVAVFRKELEKEWEELPPVFISSSVAGQGKAEILEFIRINNQEYGSLIIADE
ncbi:MAG TPA: ribosome biogenesis GTP-binding protein YihA/YsxC [Bacteroidales bacterium]|jgi:GTP-binding protein|nr:ribosome biogenesis GTP-binding protein YihA/YsxC [Bacteroidales bacterium]